MKSFVLDTDGKPCVWPVPTDCTWTGEIYDIDHGLKISTDAIFVPEVLLFAESCSRLAGLKMELTDRDADISVSGCDAAETGEGSYFLNAGEAGVMIKAGTRRGVFHAFQTLLQLIVNSPGMFICGADIKLGPAEPLRCLAVSLPGEEEWPAFKRYIDFIAKYRFNKLILSAAGGNPPGGPAKAELADYISKRNIEIVFEDQDEVIYFMDTIYKVLKSCASRLSEASEKVIAQLYTIERDIISGKSYPSRHRKHFKTLNLRDFYNAPLYRLSWRSDDYDFMYLADAPFIPNTAPLSIFQGVNDYKLDASFILAGNKWNNGIYGMPVNCSAKSLVFLHSYIVDRRAALEEKGRSTDTGFVGHYAIHYADGTFETADVVYGRTISCWKADSCSCMALYDANPVFTGTASYGDRYVIFAQEWINPKPDVPVEKVDLIPVEGLNDEGIALFAITAIL